LVVTPNCVVPPGVAVFVCWKGFTEAQSLLVVEIVAMSVRAVIVVEDCEDEQQSE
jgi:hypothetical protein